MIHRYFSLSFLSLFYFAGIILHHSDTVFSSLHVLEEYKTWRTVGKSLVYRFVILFVMESC